MSGNDGYSCDNQPYSVSVKHSCAERLSVEWKAEYYNRQTGWRWKASLHSQRLEVYSKHKRLWYIRSKRHYGNEAYAKTREDFANN